MITMSLSYMEIISFSLVILLPFLYETNGVFRYYFKFCVYYTYVMVCCVILLPSFMLKPFRVGHLRIASAFCHYISPLIGVRWELRGKDYIQQDKSFIIVANHQSSLDVLGMLEIWPIMNKCTAVAKKELFYAFPFGLASWLCGLIFIDRMNSQKAREVLDEATHAIKAKNIKLWLYPEGTRRNTGEIHLFKKGAFHLAVGTNTPLLPIVFSRYYFLNSTEKIFDQGKVVITALPPIETNGLTSDNVNDLMEKTRRLMIETFDEVNKEMHTKGGTANVKTT